MRCWPPDSVKPGVDYEKRRRWTTPGDNGRAPPSDKDLKRFEAANEAARRVAAAPLIAAKRQFCVNAQLALNLDRLRQLRDKRGRSPSPSKKRAEQLLCRSAGRCERPPIFPGKATYGWILRARTKKLSDQLEKAARQTGFAHSQASPHLVKLLLGHCLDPMYVSGQAAFCTLGRLCPQTGHMLAGWLHESISSLDLWIGGFGHLLTGGMTNSSLALTCDDSPSVRRSPNFLMY